MATRFCFFAAGLSMSLAGLVHADELAREQHVMTHHLHSPAITSSSPLTEAGNDAFGTLQEAVEKLNSDPATDWSKVDLEALRQHLIDMRNFTLNVDVLSKEAIDNGVRVTIRPTTPAAEASLGRVLPAHAMQLKRETGWQMDINKEQQLYSLEVRTERANEIEKIRGLGYIGIMATGNHHQLHHWLMITGQHPHVKHR